MSSGLIIRSSTIHAAGCYATRPFRKGQRVVEYSGPRLTKAEADKRYADRFVTYLFGVGDRDTVIDGCGTAMFINHSCSPNCETQEHDGRIFVVALRKLAAGEELTYEYNLYDSDEDTQDCYCGAPNCRGTMFSIAEIERRRRKSASRARNQPRTGDVSSPSPLHHPG